MAQRGTFRARTLVIAVLSCLPSAVYAQDFGLLESAETIDRGAFKLKANPMVIFGKDAEENEAGVGGELGYGITDRFDIKGGIALYDGVTFVGADVEYWVLQDRPGVGSFDMSLIGGFHVRTGSETLDTAAIDLTFLGSKHVNSRLELYGALDFAFESITEDDIDESFVPIHLIPGFEFRVARDVDLVGEFGIALNDDARHYVSGGIAYYFR